MVNMIDQHSIETPMVLILLGEMCLLFYVFCAYCYGKITVIDVLCGLIGLTSFIVLDA